MVYGMVVKDVTSRGTQANFMVGRVSKFPYKSMN